MNLFSLLTITSLLSFGSMYAQNRSDTLSPLNRLIEGNLRYVNSTTVCHDDWSAKRQAQVDKQSPFAIILTCSDSRVPPEIIFDQALGSLFVIRVAGNVVDEFAIGSIEYGVLVLGADTIVVLGHSNCGAVDGALKNLKFDNHIQEVLNAIQPAITGLKGDSKRLLEEAIKANVLHVEKLLKTSQPLLYPLVQQNKLSIKGAYYDLLSGKVEFLDNMVDSKS